MNSNKKRYPLICITLLLIAAIGGAIYMYWYVPRTPVYTLNIIRTAIKDHDVNTIFKHVDTKSIVNNTVDREFNKDEHGGAKTFAPFIKQVATATVNNLIIEKVTANDEGTASEVVDNNASTKEVDNNLPASTSGNPLEMLQEKFTSNKEIDVKNISSSESDGIATIAVTLENNKTNAVVTLELLAKQLDDGTWRIYDVPNLADLGQLNSNTNK